MAKQLIINKASLYSYQAEKENSMGKFDEIRKIMKEFKSDMDSLASNKINEEQTARARLNPTALEEELTSLDAEYDGHFKSTRNRYKERLNEAITDRRKGNANKYIRGYIDYDLLNKMNIISQSGVELTEAELSDFCREAMRSRSEFCIRKCQLMAKDNHFNLEVPSEAKANNVLDEVEKIANKVVSQYTGKLTGLEKGYFGNDGESMSIKVYAEGNFLNNYERQYEKQTIEDIRISYISKENYSDLEAEKKKKAENQPVELVNADKVNINTKSTSEDSPAAKYAKAYSERMSTVNPEFE